MLFKTDGVRFFINGLCICTIHKLTLYSFAKFEGFSFSFYASNNKKELGLRIFSWTRCRPRPSAFVLLCEGIGGINWPLRLEMLSINLTFFCAVSVCALGVIPFFLRLSYPFLSPCHFLSTFPVSLHFFQSIPKSFFCYLFIPSVSERKNLNAFYSSSL
jgi:hypothetical protein